MRTVSIEPPELGVADGLAYALFTPAGECSGGVVILHGADSAKESHYDFARLLRSSGVAAVCFDARGHGESSGALGPSLLDDVVTMRGLLPAGLPVGLRGSSMGGWTALAAAERAGAAAVVAICPATSTGLARGLREGRFDFRADPGLAGALEAVDIEAAASRLGERLLLLHADGDEVVPVAVSRRLHEVATGSRLVVTPGGHHRSIQHDSELQAFAARWLQSAFQTPQTPRNDPGVRPL
jgi:pimeloyl-ACP methyl ester carboxylesterase